MAKDKAKPISDLMATVIRLGINYGEPRVEAALPDGSFQEELALSVFPPVRATVVALNDDNADNAGQMKQVWVEEWLHANLRPILKKKADLLAGKIKDGNVLAVVTLVLEIINDILGFFTDNDDDDAAQIKEYFNELFTSEEFRDIVIENVIVGLLKSLNAQPGIIDLVRSIFLEIWKSYTENRSFSLSTSDLGLS
jgi:hypothetical protein